MESQVKIPKVRRSTHDLSCQTITTTDLYNIAPVFSRMTIPNDKFVFEVNQLNRCAPMPYSSFVRIKNRLSAFYVKYNQIWKPFDAFTSNVPYAFDYQNTIPTELPFFNPFDIQRLLRFPGLSAVVNIDITGLNWITLMDRFKNHQYDFLEVSFGEGGVLQTAAAVNLSAAGRIVYSTLVSLGYRIPSVSISGPYSPTGDVNTFKTDCVNLHQSLLPLFAYLSVRVNYFTPVKFRDYKFINSFAYLINPFPWHAQSSWNGVAVTNEFYPLYRFIVDTILNVYYGADYFTSSLIRPFKNNGNGSGQNDIVGASGMSVLQDSQGDAFIASDNTTDFEGFTQYMLNLLKSQTSINQLGALTLNDVVGAVTAKMGYKPEVADMMPFLLKHVDDHIRVSPEIQTASTDQLPLGYKAGMAEGQALLKGKFDFDTFGQFLVISSVSPCPNYTEGVMRELLDTRKDMFYDPLKTNAGLQAIANAELSLDIKSSEFDDSFGFTPKDAHLGNHQDVISGDFCINTRNATLDAMHFKRNIGGSGNRSMKSVVNDKEFSLARYFDDESGTYYFFDKNDYDRIFVVEESGEDHIQQWNVFDIRATRSIAASGDFTIGDDYDGQRIESKGIGDVKNA